ncbi:MAG TPA: PAS domain S-box protein [Leptospiraceae bacterium]|nr:PAS domain S-box protein [Leptospiraceae bacterium]
MSDFLKNSFFELIHRDETVLEFVLENGSAGIWFLDIFTGEEWMNGTFWKSLGYEPGELQNSPNVHRTLIYGKDVNFHIFSRAPETAEHLSEQMLRYVHKSGEIVWVKSRIRLFRNKEGFTEKILGANSIFKAAQKKTEYMPSVEKFESILAGQFIFFLTTDLQGRYTYANRHFCNVFNIELSEILGMSGLTHIIPEDHGKCHDTVMKCVQNPNQVFSVILRKPRPDGTVMYSEWDFTGVTDSEGFLNRIQCTGRDTTERVLALQAVTEKNQELSSILDALDSSALVTIADRDGRILKANRKLCDLFGFEEAELLGRDHSIFNSGFHSREFWTEMWDMISQGRTWRNEIRNRGRDGREFWLDTVVNPIFDIHGQISQFLSISTDITKRKNAEIELLNEKEKNEAIIKALPDILFVIDSEGHYREVLTSEPEKLAVPVETVPNLRVTDIFGEDEGERHLNEYKAALLTGRLRTFEYSLLIGDSERHFEARIVPLGKSGLVLAIVRDITEEKIAKEMLLFTKEQLEQTGRIARVGGWEYNIIKDTLYWSEVTKEIHDLDLSTSPDSGFSTRYIASDEDRLRIQEKVKKSFTDRVPWTDELKVITAKGREIWIKTIGQIKFREDRPELLYGVIQDITEKKEAELNLLSAKQAAESANRAKSEFLANMTHEIRTPLNGIIGFTDLLMQTEMNETQKKYLSAVYQSGSFLLEIVNDILDFSKIEAGKLELSVEKTDIYEMCGQIQDIVRFQADKKKIGLSVIIPDDAPRFIYADEIRFRQVLINLLSNAIKFTVKGRVELKLEILDRISSDETRFRFSVSDTGIGIAPANRQKIFEAFSQEDASTTKKFGGTGLGLTISSRLLSLMNSSLQLESEQGKGSVFFFDIVLPTEAGLPDFPVYGQEFKSVLISGNREYSILMIRDMLYMQNINSEAVSGSGEVFRLLSGENKFDALIIDSELYEADGLSSILKIRKEMNIPFSDLPILVVCANEPDEKLRHRLQRERLAEFLLKPFHFHDLLDAMFRLKNQSSAIEETNTEQFTALIVEDNRTNMLLLSRLLSSLFPNVRILEAGTGNDALGILNSDLPDIVFMDIQMPDKSGYETTEEIRRTHKWKDIPIIAVTAGSSSEERERCFQAGMNDFLLKPIQKSGMESLIKQWLNRKP